ncbi:metallophosphoesterase [Paucidesulfovibrio longus]|uniref:metallophosphoesterase n=1 Tax=Paucidesulfovibrio longus TaxID=889 RepID=UPI0003B59BAF|nr:metallophosphoesterase [Paucidesulfovibrio longus]
MFHTILALVVTALHGYLFWRLSSIPVVRRHVPRAVLFALAAALWGCFFLDRLLAPEAASALGVFLELWSMSWMAMLFLMFVAVFAVDAATCFGLLLRRRAPTLRGAAFLVGIAFSCLALIQGLRPPEVEEYDVNLPGLPAELDGTVLVALSDLHLGTLLGREWLDARVRQVEALRPDLVVLTGDVFEGHGVPGEDLIAGLRGLSAPLGVWGVLGNHDLHMPGMDIGPVFARSGVRLLRNSRVQLAPGLVLAGVDNLSSRGDQRNIPAYFSRTLDGRPQGAAILLSHAPVGAKLAEAKGIGLMLAGHTHGGQIWPFGYLVKRQFRYFTGAYRLGPMTLIVSRGTGTWGPRMRLWLPGEIQRIALHPG